MPINLGDENTWKCHDPSRQSTSSFPYSVVQRRQSDTANTFAYYNRNPIENATPAPNDTAVSFFERHANLYSYMPLKNFFLGRGAVNIVDAICAEMIRCFPEQKLSGSGIHFDRTKIFEIVRAPFSQPVIQPDLITTQPTSGATNTMIPIGHTGFNNIAFDSAYTSLMLAFMTMIYDYDTQADEPRLAKRMAKNLRGLSAVADDENLFLEKLIARAICRYFYELMVNATDTDEHTRFKLNADPYTCTFISGAIVPALLLAMPPIASFVTSLTLSLQIVLPGAFLALGLLLSQFPEQNHDQDFDDFPVATRVQQDKVRTQWAMGCGAAFGTTAQMLTPMLLSKYSGATIAAITSAPALLGVGAITAAVTYLIVTQLQRRGYITEAPCSAMWGSLESCFGSLFSCPQRGDYQALST